jgi:UDP-hydrolysing UDP-N-acetyl-D-glucosamine 2-epimerase
VRNVLQRLSESSESDLSIVLSGAGLVHDYGDLHETIERDGLEIEQEIHTLLEGGAPVTQAKTTGMSLIEFANSLRTLHPDAVLTTGDRYETMATTIAAAYLNLPVVHLEGGEITGSIDDRVRHATTKMADYHLVSTEKSAEVVKRMGESSDRVYRTGCPSTDICQEIIERGETEYDPQDEYGGTGADIDVTDDYLVIQYHPLPTEYESMYGRTWELIEAVDEIDVPAFWFWPNPDSGNEQVAKAMREYRGQWNPDDIHFYINLDPQDFLTLVSNSACVVGNSSVGIRECSYFGVPTVNIGKRQQYRERGENVLDVDPNTASIVEGIETQLGASRYERSEMYGDGQASERIVSFLETTTTERKGSMVPSDILGVGTHEC